MTTAIVWFRRDLRLTDNPALEAALRMHAQVIPVYIDAPHEEAPWQPGAASRWWLHHSLRALGADLRSRGSSLRIERGDSLAVLGELARTVGASAVYWNRLYEPALVARDATLKAALRADGIEAHSHKTHVLFEPWELATAQGDPYRVFTPFWRKARSCLQLRPPLDAPARIATPRLPGCRALRSLGLLPRTAWDTGLRATWTPGEAGARSALDRFIETRLADYAQGRDRPDRAATSTLSAHLHFGEISPMHVAWDVDQRLRASDTAWLREGGEAFLRELGWREFSQHLLHHYPHMPERNLNPRFDAFEWAADDPAAIACWQRGRTGIPIIDAGMRELWASGTMHNRVRMLVASFLTKNLRQHWLHGARWFWDTLVDADLANNAQGWQWTAGVGVDAAPYFRIFNPVTQARRFDPDGDYVRRWVPELAEVPAASIHEPWTDASILARTGYPPPLVDLAISRESALAAYRQMPRTPERL